MLLISHILISGALLLSGSEQPKLLIRECDFGVAYAFTTLTCEVAVTNIGNKVIHITDAIPIIPRDKISPSRLTVLPKSTVYLKAEVDTGHSLARTRHRFEIKTDEQGHERRVLSVRGFVLSVLDKVAPKLDFGVIDTRKSRPRKQIHLDSHASASFRIERILNQPSFATAEIGDDHHNLDVVINHDVSWGIHQGFVKIDINTPYQKEAWVEVDADVHGEVIPDLNPIDLGLLRFGNDNETLLRLTDRKNLRFKIGSIVLEGVVGSTKVSDCVPDRLGCQLIHLVISDRQPEGAIRGQMWVSLPAYDQRLRIDIHGLILEKNVKVHNVDPFRKDEVGHGDGDGLMRGLSSVGDNYNVARSLKATTNSDSIPPTPPGTGPLLKWSVSNGLRIYGFQVFRSAEEKGSFIIVDKYPIKSVASDESSTTYQWRDNSAVPGKTYWYYIGVVYNDGHKQQLSGPQKVIAK